MAEITFKFPGFFDQEIDQSSASENISGTPAGLIGTSHKGQAFVPTLIGSISVFNDKFGTAGGDKTTAELAAQQFFLNGSALRFVRVLGAGGNTTSTDIATTNQKGTVKGAGFVITSGEPTDARLRDGRHIGAVQFLAAQHSIVAASDAATPYFTDNDSFGLSAGSGTANVLRGVLLMASGTCARVMDYGQRFSQANISDDVATPSTDKLFKLVLSSSSPGFYSSEGFTGIKIFTASFDPDSDRYIGKILNTNPERFQEEEHLLYLHFPIEDTVATISTTANSVAILSGTVNTSQASGDQSLAFRDAFGRYDTRFSNSRTPTFISQPFGATEYDLFHFETVDDGAMSSKLYKVSITNIKKSTDPTSPYGTFSVQVRDFYDSDLAPVILEQFSNCNLNPESPNYIAALIGDSKRSFNFDAASTRERRINNTGRYPNKSSKIRVVMNDNVERRVVPGAALPFGYRGFPTMKTTDALSDDATRPISGGATVARRLTGVGSVSGLIGSIVPPVPHRFKVTRNAINATQNFVGDPSTTEVADSRLYWGVKFERSPALSLFGSAYFPNAITTPNDLIENYSKFMGISKLDVLVTGSQIDAFNNNKFTLARVALANSLDNRSADVAITDLTGSADDHMLAAAYIRNGKPAYGTLTINDPVNSQKRMTLGTLVALTSSDYFNRFSQYNKFSTFFYGGFDGTNILDRDMKILDDRACSGEDSGKAKATLDIGLRGFTPGTSTSNAYVASYNVGADLLTDKTDSDVNMICVPGIKDPSVTDYVSQKVSDFQLAMYVMDIPSYDDQGKRIYDTATPNIQNTISRFSSRGINNSHVAVYYPDVSVVDANTGSRVRTAASSVALGALAQNDAISNPWFAPAGFNRTALANVAATSCRLNSTDRDDLYDARINPIVRFPGTGFVIFGQKTLQSTKSALDRVNVRRLLISLKRDVGAVASRFLFEQNDSKTRANFVASVTPVLLNVQTQQGVSQFKIICDETNNTQSDVINNTMNVRIIIVPTRAVEYISIDFIINNTGVQFV
jgi:hypothetical protein